MKLDLNKKYKNCDGEECNILQLVKQEPEWAANIIQHYEQKLAELKGSQLEKHCYNSAAAEDEINQLNSLNNFTEQIIHGPGGWDEYKKYELPIYDDENLVISDWTIRCLANIGCENSELIVNEIIKKRNADKEKKQAAASL